MTARLVVKDKDRRGDTFERKTFTVSRLAEFVSKSELTKQIGHPVEDWPLVILKEGVDNALDESEEAGVPPVIEIAVEPGSITIRDSGRGIPAETVEKLIDYSARTSSRAAYASPTRGAQGNALQTIIAMPFALAREDCETVAIEARGVEHRIAFATDLIRQTPKPVIERRASPVKKGTRLTVLWPDSAKLNSERGQVRFLTTRRDLHLAQPALKPFPDLARRYRIRGRFDLARLDALAAERADLRALVQRRNPAAPDRG
jgi:DNA topoisomerase VI subunit B